MKLIEDFKNYIGRWQLEREIKGKRIKRKRLPFDQMNHIGIVYNANSKENEFFVTEYANRLRSEGKKVFMMGFVDSKHLPSDRKFVLNSEFFWKEKLNGVNLPIKGAVGQFLQIEFDGLLNLYHEPLLPMQALAAYSKARYRVGPHIEGGLDYYDFMLDTGNRPHLTFLIEQIDFYLRNIN